jgi:hypothetical protein
MKKYPEDFAQRVRTRWGAIPIKDRVFFMHVPKTAGTAVKWYLQQLGIETYHDVDPHPFPQLLIPNLTVPIQTHVNEGTLGIASQEMPHRSPNKFENALKFSLTRNPFSWLVSWYLHGSPETEDGWGDVNYIYGIRSFPEFAEKFCSPKIRWNHGVNSQYWNMMMYSQWFTREGSPVVNFAIRSDNLFVGMEKLWRAIGFITSDQEIRHPPRESSNFGLRHKKDYREYYDSASREIVEKYFARELQVFGYDFNGPTDERIIYDIERMQLSYTLNNDLFMCKDIQLSRG